MFTIGNVNLTSSLLLAPIAGFCDLAFRLVVRSIPAYRPPSVNPADEIPHPLGLASTDLLCPEAILRENTKSLWLAATHPDDQPLCMQLYGRHPDTLAEAGRWAEANGATIIDVNMGCPVDKVTKKNGGSKLLTEPCLAVEIIEKLVKAVDVPVTAKIRLGWDDEHIITQDLPARLADVGVQAVTVHGRTTEQKFRGNARLATDGIDSIHAVVESMAKHHPGIPVIGNGDVKTPEDAKRMLDITGCAGIMIGRGALRKPWLFRDTAYYLQTGTLPPPLSRHVKAQYVLDHFENLLHYRGERVAVNTISQRISWYSAELQPWPGLRREVRHIKSTTEMRDFFAAGMERMMQNESHAEENHQAKQPILERTQLICSD